MDETLYDLTDDFKELHVLATTPIQTLKRFECQLKQGVQDYMPQTHAYLVAECQTLRSRYESVAGDIIKAQGNMSREHIPELLEIKKTSSNLLRVLQSSFGALVNAGNWQSPSFDSIFTSEAGSETGSVQQGVNDYHRDAHNKESFYGKAFRSAYIDHPLRLPPHVCITNSGMAAITTILTLLSPTVSDENVVLVGRSTYFQSKWVAEKLFAGKVIYVDESDTDEILRLAQEHRPPIILLDTLANAPHIPVLDTRRLVPALAALLSQKSTLVLDNTCLATTYQPLKDLPLNPLGMRLFVVESLMKYHQFGMDRAMAGVVWGPLDLFHEEAYISRMHGGTIISDALVSMLPTPDRTLFDTRLRRIGRNAQILAEKIDTAARMGSKAISHVVYPGLPTYPQYAWTKDMSFHGGFLTLAFNSSYDSLLHYDRFVTRVLKRAQEKKVALVGGTSFGFNTTRISVPARFGGTHARAFVRIAAGTETKQEIDELANVIALAVRQ